MRIFSSLIALWVALTPVLRIVWPAISSQPFPFPGYRNVDIGPWFITFTFFSIGMAVWVLMFPGHVYKQRFFFLALSFVCFLVTAVFISVPLGLGFAMLSLAMRTARKS
jgi:hypothetical protein